VGEIFANIALETAEARRAHQEFAHDKNSPALAQHLGRFSDWTLAAKSCAPSSAESWRISAAFSVVTLSR